MLFWIAYILLNLAISFLAIFFVKNNFLRVFYFFIFCALSSWFIEPGSSEVAPILSILFLEFSITESNGFFRLLRPFIFINNFSLLLNFLFH